jgi:SAM-dependent methyltransferase
MAAHLRGAQTVGTPMRELTECLVCKGNKFSEYAQSTFSGSVHDASQYFLANRRGVVHGRIVECRDCGFKFTNPQFNARDYDDIYKDAPRDSTISMETADARRFRRLAKYVRQDVDNRHRFLDFGCGRGGFLEAMNDPAGNGFEVGVPSKFMAGASTVTTGRFFDVVGREPFIDGAFDFITAFDVFEHLPDLAEYVDALSRLLTPKGRLIVTVPDGASWNAKLSGRRWNMYLLEHLWYFHQKTLNTFMNGAGFRQISHRSVPYDASLAHLARRVGQTYAAFPPSLAKLLPEFVIPVPIGVMYSVFEKSKPSKPTT